MMSRSSSSKGLVRDGVRRSLWAVVLSTLAFVVSMLLPSLMNMQQALEDRKGMIVDGARASELAQSWLILLIVRSLFSTHLFTSVSTFRRVKCGVSCTSFSHGDV